MENGILLAFIILYVYFQQTLQKQYDEGQKFMDCCANPFSSCEIICKSLRNHFDSVCVTRMSQELKNLLAFS